MANSESRTEVVDERDLSKPIVRRKKLSGVSAKTYQTRIDFGDYGTFLMDESPATGGDGAGPSPLHTVVAALCGCERVTFERTSQDMGFAYDHLEFEAEYTVDIRGRMGVREVRPHFQTVRMQATVVTHEAEELLRDVVAETERRCPVYNLIAGAGVKLETLWVRRAPDPGAEQPT